MRSAAIVLSLLLSGCGATYRVQRDQLARSEIVPAVREDGTQTWIDRGAIDEVGPGRDSSEAEVHVHDRGATLQLVGSILAYVGVGSVMLGAFPGDTHSPDPLGASYRRMLAIGSGGLLTAVGGSLFLAGSLAAGPESVGPRTDLALPPPR